MALVVVLGAAVLVLHTHIMRTFPANPPSPSPLPARGAAVSPSALAKPDVHAAPESHAANKPGSGAKLAVLS